MARKNSYIKVHRENAHGFNTIALAMYFFLFKGRNETLKATKHKLTWEHFDNLFAIYLFEKTGDLATYAKLSILHDTRLLKGINKRTVQRWCNTLEKKGLIEMINRYESISTGGRRIESQIVTTIKGKAIITKFLRICLEYAHLLPDFSLLEKDIK